MDNILKLYVDNTSTTLSGPLRGDFYKEFKRELAYQPEDYLWRQGNNPNWDGYISCVCYSKAYCKCPIKKDGMHFPTGLISKAVDFLRSKGVTVEIVDVRGGIELNNCGISLSNKSLYSGEPFALYDYQKDVVDRAVNAQRGVIKLATGAGKTKTAAGIIAVYDVKPTIFFVTSQDLLRQAKSDLEEVLLHNGSPIKVGAVGAGYKEIRDVTVMTVQTAIRALDSKYIKFDDEDENDNTDISDVKKDIAELIHSAKLVFFDECQHVAADTCQIVADHACNSKHRFGLSVFPESQITLRGDVFGPFYNGTIEKAWNQLNGKVRHFDEFEIKDVSGNIESRSWNGSQFVWKPLQRILRHRNDRRSFAVRFAGKDELKLTEDHSVYVVRSGDLTCVTPEEIQPNDLLALDNGSIWETECNYTIWDIIGDSVPGKWRVGHRISKDESAILELGYHSMYQLAHRGTVAKTHGGSLRVSQLRKLSTAVQPKWLYTEGARGVGIDPSIKLSSLQYLFGFFLGDGWISGHRLCFAIESAGVDRFVRHLKESIPGVRPKIRQMTGKSVEVRVSNAPLSFLFRKLFGNNKCHQKYIPSLLVGNYLDRRQLLRGLVDSDGSRKLSREGVSRNRTETRFATTSVQLAEDVKMLLRSLDVAYTVNIRQPTMGRMVNGRRITGKRASYQIIWSGNSELGVRSGRKGHRSKFPGVITKRVLGIQRIDSSLDSFVYDLEVSGHPSFVANGVLVHNSATPWRDKGDDILIHACFGKEIVNINASWLIQNGFLVKPYIAFIPMKNMKGEKLGAYPAVYKQAIVENAYRNEMIANLAANLVEQNRTVLVLVQQIVHGNLLEDLIPGSVFLHGSCTKKQREEHLAKIRSGHAPVTIASSLPYEELLLVRIDGWVRQIEIGDLCHQYADMVSSGRIETLCSKDGKTLSWSKITHVHIHPNTHDILRVRTNMGEETLVTSNHSLVDADLNMTAPIVGNAACVPQRFDQPQIGSRPTINVVDLLKRHSDQNIEVEVTGIGQKESRTLSKVLAWYNDPQSVCKSSRLKFSKKFKDYPNEYFLALAELFSKFHFYKRRRRTDIVTASSCKHIQHYFETSIYIRRSRSKFCLPWFVKVSENLSTFLGCMAAEGCIKEYANSRFDVVFSGVDGTTDGKYDANKQNIRKIVKSLALSSLGWKPSFENWQQVRFNGKLPHLFLSSLGLVDRFGEKCVPDVILNGDFAIRDAFLYGVYLGDGSATFQNGAVSHVSWHTTSRRLYVGLWTLLQMNEHHVRIDIASGRDGDKDIYSLSSRDSVGPLKTHICGMKRDYLCSRRIQKNVTLLENRKENELVYDVSVDGCHNFIGGTILCHNTIFDEGIDCKPLDALILAGGGKSATRALQRIGRVIRTYTYPDGRKKENAYVYDIYDHQKYVSQHAFARRRIYMSEPEFDIRQVD